MVGYQRFGEPCCLKMEAARPSETSLSYTESQKRRPLPLNLHRSDNLKSRIGLLWYFIIYNPWFSSVWPSDKYLTTSPIPFQFTAHDHPHISFLNKLLLAQPFNKMLSPEQVGGTKYRKHQFSMPERYKRVTEICATQSTS